MGPCVPAIAVHWASLVHPAPGPRFLTPATWEHTKHLSAWGPPDCALLPSLHDDDLPGPSDLSLPLPLRHPPKPPCGEWVSPDVSVLPPHWFPSEHFFHLETVLWVCHLLTVTPTGLDAPCGQGSVSLVHLL